MRLSARRPRALGYLFALVVCLVPLAIAHAEAPIPTSVAIMHVQDLRPGMKGYGKTVFRGTQVEEFPVTILGVVKNYIAESDLILIRVDGGYPQKHGVGIVAGMSGSPVYVNGRLIGAISYGWPFSKEPVGGVTPIESMLKDMPGRQLADNEMQGLAPDAAHSLRPGPRALPSPIELDGRTLTQVQLVPNSDAARQLHADAGTVVLSPVPSLFQVSGFSERAFAGIEKTLRPLNLEPVRTFTASAAPMQASIPAMVPGAAVGVQLLGGDLEISGTGTLTYVDGKRFLAFGHPMAQLGEVELPLTAAYVQDILPSYSRPFKFASQIGQVGVLSSDRLWAVGGYLGRSAPMIPVTIHMSESSRNLHKTYHLRAIQHRLLTAAIVTAAMEEGLSSVVPVGADTTAIVDYHIKPRGRPMLNLQQMSEGATVDASVVMQFNDYLATLTNNDFAPLALDSVDVDVRIIPGKHTATIEKIYTTRNSYHRGENVDVHVVMRPYGQGSLERIVQVPVPADMEKGQIMIGVGGGGDMTALRKRLMQTKAEPTNIEQLLEQLMTQERGQQLIVKASYPTHAAVLGQERFSFLPESLRDVLPNLPQSDVSAEKDFFEQRLDTDWVVRGTEVVAADVEVTPDGERKKPAEPSAPTPALDDDGTAQPSMSTPPHERITQAADKKPDAAPAKAVTDAKQTADKRKVDVVTAAEKVLPSGTRRWDIRDALAFSQGRFDGTSLSSNGDIGLAPRSDTIFEAGGEVPWSMALDSRDGTLFVGTAMQGRVLCLTPSKTGGSWHRKPEIHVGDSAITALATTAGGTVWIGTAPHGRVYRRVSDGVARFVLDTKAAYVWTIVPLADGGALVGTGNPATLVHVARDGQANVVQRFPERHLRVVVRTRQGDTLVATANPGVVYRLTAGHPPQVLFATQFGSADALLERGNGEVVAASGKLLYRSPANSRPRAVTVSDKPLLGLSEERDGTLLASSADGKVYSIDAHDTVTRVADFLGGPVMAMIASNDGTLVATAAPGTVRRIDGQVGGEGTWTSEVLDAGSPAHWGRIRWMAEGRTAGLTLQTRSGFTPTPDDTWSAWSAAYTEANGMPVASPPARYLQVRARLGTPNAGASSSRAWAEGTRLCALSIFFRDDDLQPALEITRPLGGTRFSGSPKIEWKIGGSGVEVTTCDLSYTRDGKDWTVIQKGVGPTVKETALTAPHGAESTQTEVYTWDTRKIPDGVYRIRIETYDVSHPDDVNRLVVVSKPFVVTNTPPRLETFHVERLSDGRVRCSGVAVGHLASIVSVAFRRTDQKDWQIARPDDGVYDSDREGFTFVTSGDPQVEIRVTDEAGNSRTECKPLR